MNTNKEKVGYYSVIPSTILYNKNLKANEKLLYAMITSLACKEGHCFATNSYFAEELGVHPKTVSSWISDLRAKKFIKVDIVRNENKQIIQRKIYINDVPYPLNNVYMYGLKNGQAMNQKTEDNNIRNNIKIILKHTEILTLIIQIKENIQKNFWIGYMQIWNKNLNKITKNLNEKLIKNKQKILPSGQKRY